MKASQRYRLHRLAAELVTPARFAASRGVPIHVVPLRIVPAEWRDYAKQYGDREALERASLAGGYV